MNWKQTCGILSVVALLQGCVAAAVVGVVGGATVAADNRTLGSQIDDQKIEFDAYAKLSENEGLSDNTNLQVVSINGSVLVVGQAPNEFLRDQAIKALGEIQRVVQVHDQIRIGNVTSLATRSNDLFLTSKVKTALFGSEKIDATNIKVVTENAEVFLMGLVNKAEAESAVDIARNVSGVNRVIKAFEYL
ncbi:MAG: BON domain-containing protein [Pseudoalteromonas spongiae]